MGGEDLLTYANDCVLSSEYGVGVTVTQKSISIGFGQFHQRQIILLHRRFSNMGGEINITGTVIERFVIDGVERPTLSFLRGNTYVFDITDASMSDNALVLV